MTARSKLNHSKLVGGSLLLSLAAFTAAAAAPGEGPAGADGPPSRWMHAQGPGMDRDHWPMHPDCERDWHRQDGGLHAMFLGGLKLSEEQQDRIFAIEHAAAPALRDQRKALSKAHEALRGLATAAQYDEAKTKALTDAAAKAESQLMLLHIRGEHEIYEVLTPEQRASLADRRAKWETYRGRPQDGGGRDAPPPPPPH